MPDFISVTFAFGFSGPVCKDLLTTQVRLLGGAVLSILFVLLCTDVVTRAPTLTKFSSPSIHIVWYSWKLNRSKTAAASWEIGFCHRGYKAHSHGTNLVGDENVSYLQECKEFHGSDLELESSCKCTNIFMPFCLPLSYFLIAWKYNFERLKINIWLDKALWSSWSRAEPHVWSPLR